MKQSIQSRTRHIIVSQYSNTCYKNISQPSFKYILPVFQTIEKTYVTILQLPNKFVRNVHITCKMCMIPCAVISHSLSEHIFLLLNIVCDNCPTYSS